MANYWFIDAIHDKQFTDLYKLGDAVVKGGTPWASHMCTTKYSGKQWTVKIFSKKDESRRKPSKLGHLIAVEHNNLMRVKEVFESSDELYVVVQSDDEVGALFDKLSCRETYAEQDVADCIKQILEAIRYLHLKGITHGNLKPENLMYKENLKGQLTVLVGEYSLGCIFGQNTLRTLNVCTATDYCAPEILKGKNLETPVDMWAIGVLTYILLCGYEPFRSDIEAEKFKLILKCDFMYDPFDWADVSENAKDFVRKLIQPDPKSRPTATVALKHRWLNGAAPRARQLEAAPNRLKQYTNKRQLKLLTEVAKPFNSLEIADTFPRHYSTLEHLMDPASTDVSASSSVAMMAGDAPVRPADSAVRAVLAARDPNDTLAPWAGPDLAEGYKQGDKVPGVDTGDDSMPSCHKEAILLIPGMVFGEPLPYSVPSDGNYFLTESAVDQLVTSQLFPQQMSVDADLYMSYEPAPELELTQAGGQEVRDELPPDMPLNLLSDTSLTDTEVVENVEDIDKVASERFGSTLAEDDEGDDCFD